MTKLKCWKKIYYIIDEYKKIEGGVQGCESKRRAEKIKNEMIVRRSKRGQTSINREFGRSKNLKVVEGQKEVKC